MEEKKTYPEKTVSIIIINWNGEKYLHDCIKSARSQNYGVFEIILVDNASKDNSLCSLPKDVILIKNDSNKGFCAAANQGIKTASGEFIILLNQDIILDRNFIKKIIDTFTENKNTGMVSGKILRMDKKTIDSTGQFMNYWLKPVERGYNKKDYGQFDKKTEIFSVCGAAACYRREMLEDIKIEIKTQVDEKQDEYFDENFFAFYEDMDLGWRAQSRGWRAFYNPEAIVYHQRGGTQKGKQRFQILGRSPDLQLKIIANRYFMIIKNISKTHFLVYSPFLLIRSTIDLLFIIFYIKNFKKVLNEMILFKPAWEKRGIIKSRKLVSDKIIRKFIV
ncbi:MAG: glycosyltransferase family 2 protein [bacterium]